MGKSTERGRTGAKTRGNKVHMMENRERKPGGPTVLTQKGPAGPKTGRGQWSGCQPDLTLTSSGLHVVHTLHQNNLHFLLG